MTKNPIIYFLSIILGLFLNSYSQFATAETTVLGDNVNPDHVIDADMSIEKQMEYEDTLAGAELTKEEVQRLKKNLEDQRKQNKEIQVELARETKEARILAAELGKEIRHFRNLERVEKQKTVELEAQRELNRTRLAEVQKSATEAKEAHNKAAGELTEAQKMATTSEQALQQMRENLEELNKVIEISKQETIFLRKQIADAAENIRLLNPQMKEATQEAQDQVSMAQETLKIYQNEIAQLKQAREQAQQNTKIVARDVSNLKNQTAYHSQVPAVRRPNRSKKKVLTRAALASDCNIRKEPTAKAKVLKTTKQGSKMLVSPFNNRWLRSHNQSGKSAGFIAKSCVKGTAY